MGITSYDLLNKGIIEKIITEPSGGAQNNIKSVVKELKSSLIVEINNFNHYEQQKEKIHSPGRGNPTVLV